MYTHRLLLTSFVTIFVGCRTTEELVGDSNIYITPDFIPEFEQDSEEIDVQYSEDDLDQSREALPEISTLSMEPIETSRSDIDALFPQFLNLESTTINELITESTSFLTTMQDTEPSYYNEETKEFS